MRSTPGGDIRYTLFRFYLLVTGVSGLLFGLINLINVRPPVNVFTGAAVFLLCALWYLLSANSGGYGLSRISFLVFLSLIWLPLGYLTSPGSFSAMPYIALTGMFISAVVVRNQWEYAFPIIMLILIPALFLYEMYNPMKFDIYSDPAYRLKDLSMNFVVAGSIILITIIYTMNRYRSFNEKMYEVSVRDSLTGLYNKRFFNEYIEKEHNRSLRNKTVFSLVFIDINHFKRVNDSLGHLEGDRVLKDIAGILVSSIRNYDLAVRYGGDEFILIFPSTELEDAEHQMKRMQKELDTYCAGYREQGLSVSWGIAESRNRSVEEVLAIADEMLYFKKRNINAHTGKNDPDN
ncbi:GGDEF domain-containing protein [Salinispira pacifica]|uniref:diguanylate cyclase n=1 Tax=Salinispira pacifica TaxID=1307761 RepID=V5WIR1_9SPIO|nr:GGDEF domain-containing protein [Salinispira pacifica]AHC15683.1 hypothetical protein L21SP2_2328 [Salinispira pacifica]